MPTRRSWATGRLVSRAKPWSFDRPVTHEDLKGLGDILTDALADLDRTQKSLLECQRRVEWLIERCPLKPFQKEKA